MLNFYGDSSRYCDGLSRRNFLKIGSLGAGAGMAAGLGGLTLPDLLRAEAKAGIGSSQKSVIMVLLTGGPTHFEMFDPKPNAPKEIRGEYSAIPTNVPGLQICELMPRLANVMDRAIVIRSLTGGLDDHNMHQCITGWESHPQSFDSRDVPGYPPGGWPSIGAVVSKLQGPAVEGIPPAIDLTPLYYDARWMLKHPPCKAGFLGPAYEGFQVRAVDPKAISLNGIGMRRLSDRRTLLSGLDRFRRALDKETVQATDSFTQQAFSLMTSPDLAEALDISKEPAHIKARYGLSTKAVPEREGPKELDNLLMARRVVQAGARLVTLTVSRYPFGRMSQGDYNWDWHANLFKKARATIPMVAHGIAGLIEDLDEQGMLDDVTVVVWGEFGRTPRINKNAGRDHWPRVGNALLAGGGMPAGQVIGASNHLGEDVADRPVHFRDVMATLYHNLGIAPTSLKVTDYSNRPHYLVDGRSAMPELI